MRNRGELYFEAVVSMIEPLKALQVALTGWLQVVPYVVVNPYSPQYPQFYASAPVAYSWPAGYPPAPVILSSSLWQRVCTAALLCLESILSI